MSQARETLVHLHDTASRIARLGARPTPPHDRLTEMEKAAAKLAQSYSSGGALHERDAEPWEVIAARLDFADLKNAKRRDVRLALDRIWAQDAYEHQAVPLVTHGLEASLKTYDRELLLAYLRHFPLDHPAFGALNAAAATAADRHDWPWRERGRRFRLWEADAGPEALGAALLDTDSPVQLLDEAGLDGDLAAGAFVEDALDDACELVGHAKSAEAEQLGARLAILFGDLPVGGDNAMLAFGLLNPWRTASPSETHRKMIGGALVKRIGDPRLNPAAWAGVMADLRGKMPGIDVDALIGVLRRWLTQNTVKQFFALVGRVTKDPKQWAAREEFWLAYLDDGAILDAWFAFGRQAEHLAQSFDRSDGAQYAEITGGGADPTHSALILSIGDLRIAEWSHEGSCRFWSSADRQAPELYKRQYFGMQLRAMNGGRGFTDQFDAIPHASGWQSKFANFIYRHSGIRHPRWGEGYRVQGSR